MPARKGERHHKAKLTPELVRRMRVWRADGATYETIMERLLVEHDVEEPSQVGRSVAIS